MNKAVLMSIQPYYVFLIIARAMGWNIPQKKELEVRKDFPRDKAWNKVTHIYCSKNRKSFNRIPAQYQPFMEKLLGKVIGEFVCARISECNTYGLDGEDRLKATTCLDDAEIMDYVGYLDKSFYLLHIADLKIYDTPKDPGEFFTVCPKHGDDECLGCPYLRVELSVTGDDIDTWCDVGNRKPLTRAPQSFCYVEEI